MGENGCAVRVYNPAHRHTDGVLCAKVSEIRRAHAPPGAHPGHRSCAAALAAAGSSRPSHGMTRWPASLRARARSLRDPQAIPFYSYAGNHGAGAGREHEPALFPPPGAPAAGARTICATAGGEGLVHTLAARWACVEFFAVSRALIVIWGAIDWQLTCISGVMPSRPSARGPAWCASTRAAPRLVDKCHEHLQLPPGTDVVLALR